MQNTINIIQRPWVRGDLVKIKTSQWSGRDYESFGIVMGVAENEATKNQTKFFSEILIFDSKRSQISRYYSYDLELISAGT